MPTNCNTAKTSTSSATSATTHLPPMLKGTTNISTQLPNTHATSINTAIHASDFLTCCLRALITSVTAKTISPAPRIKRLTLLGRPRIRSTHPCANSMVTPDRVEKSAFPIRALRRKHAGSSHCCFIKFYFLLYVTFWELVFETARRCSGQSPAEHARKQTCH